MGLFKVSDAAQINAIAAKSKELAAPPPTSVSKSVSSELAAISDRVVNYFSDSPAILITTAAELHDYVTKSIAVGYIGIDTETTGLDRIHDTIVGASLYYPGGVECYIPMKHLVPILDTPYKGQLTYQEVGQEFQRFVDSKSHMIFANADFDLSMIYKDLKVDLCPVCYYDVILAWRCLKENELHNGLKELYNKYVLKGAGDPKKFSDFFSPELFPYCKPQVAKLYAANDAKITYDLFRWQLPYLTKSSKKCQKYHLESIADLVWNVEFPLIRVCQEMHRTGVYLDKEVAAKLDTRYQLKYKEELGKLQNLVKAEIDKADYAVRTKCPFPNAEVFNPNSPIHVKYLVYTMMNITPGKDGTGTGKEILSELNLPVTNQILKVRSLLVLINTFVKKLPLVTTSDSRIHAQFKQIGADTGRLSSADPNMQNIPSHATDIRHMFRASPGYVLLSSDYSAQEPRLTAFIGNEPQMIQAFVEGRDVYATIASIAFNVPYEKCLEFHPETHEYQPDGKARRGEAKTILLGITYGRSIPSIADQLYGTNSDMSDDEKFKKAQNVYDSVMVAFPGLRNLMLYSQDFARKHGYVETILGRRRHLPDMTLPEFEFKALKGYVNPDIDPLDVSTLDNRSEIPQRVIDALTQEFASYKYFGQIAKRTKELYEENIKVINNRPKINDAVRQCLNSRIQGSAADQTKMAILLLENSEEWKRIGGRILIPVHDEILAEVPIENYQKGAELLSSLMCKAAEFLPFPSKCDVEISYRWYGMSYPCPYPQPENLSNLTVEEVKWVQYHLLEMEYALPVYKDENGEKPRGDAAKGVNGIVSDEYNAAIADYIARYRISEDMFVSHIKTKVHEGV